METGKGALDTVDSVTAARALIAESSSVVVLTGAGISTDSGIPDFRGPTGLWTLNPETRHRMTLEAYLSDPDQRRRGWASRAEAPVWSAKPNPGHLALLDLERQHRLALLITQNTDGLHGAVGHSPELVVELHGSTYKTICLRCSNVVSTRDVLRRVRLGDLDPRCLERSADGQCGGVLKVATVSFGQRLDATDLRRSVEAVQTSDLLLVVGSTLRVDPAAGLVPLAARIGAAVVIVNASPTRHDDLADVVVRASISEVLAQIVT